MATTCAVRRVRSNGEIKWGGELIFVSRVLTGEPVGIAETENGEWLVRFADVELGFIDPNRRRLLPPPPAEAHAKPPVDLWTTQARCPQLHRPNNRRPRMIECQPCNRSNLSTIHPVAHRRCRQVHSQNSSYASAALTRFGANGALRSRRPVSANTALLTAGTTTGMPSSPTGSGMSPLRMTSTLICGISENRRIS